MHIIQALFSLYFKYANCFLQLNGLVTWVRKDKYAYICMLTWAHTYTCMHAYIVHTHTHTHTHAYHHRHDTPRSPDSSTSEWTFQVWLGMLALVKMVCLTKTFMHWDKSFAELCAFLCKEYSGGTATQGTLTYLVLVSTTWTSWERGTVVSHVTSISHTCVQTKMHTLWKTISRNQVRAWFKIKAAIGSLHTKSTKKSTASLSDFFKNWHKCWVHRETTPDQNLVYFEFSPLRYDQSIFEAIIHTSSFKQP